MANIPLQSGQSTYSPQPYRSTAAPDPTGQGKAVMQSLSPLADVAADARVNASITDTLSGTFASGHTVTVVFTGFGSPYTLSYTTVAGDTTATALAEHLAAAINADPFLSGQGVTASNLAGVITISWPGPVGNFIVVTGASTGSEVQTFGNSGKVAGGSGPIIPTQNFTWSAGGVMQSFWYGQPADVPYNTLAQMVAQGMPIS